MSLTEETTVAPETTSDEIEPSTLKKTSSLLGWIGLGFFCLILFTWLKLPNHKLKATLESVISQQLSKAQIRYTAEETELSFLFGPSYTLKKVNLSLPRPYGSLQLDEVRISPSILKLFIFKAGGSVEIKNGEGSLIINASTRSSQSASVSLEANQFDIGKLGILNSLYGIQASAVVSGTASLDGNLLVPSQLEASIDTKILSLSLPGQRVMGFTIPPLNVSSGTFIASAEGGKATLEKIELGDKSKKDDLIGSADGVLTLANSWPTSRIDFTARFSFSEKVQKAFVLLDAILGKAKTNKGDYAIRLTGPMQGMTLGPVEEK